MMLPFSVNKKKKKKKREIGSSFCLLKNYGIESVGRERERKRERERVML